MLTPRTYTGSVESTQLCSVATRRMNSWPSPYSLNVTRSEVDPARDQHHLLVLDVHALDRADALGNSNTSGSEKGAVV